MKKEKKKNKKKRIRDRQYHKSYLLWGLGWGEEAILLGSLIMKQQAHAHVGGRWAVGAGDGDICRASGHSRVSILAYSTIPCLTGSSKSFSILHACSSAAVLKSFGGGPLSPGWWYDGVTKGSTWHVQIGSDGHDE